MFSEDPQPPLVDRRESQLTIISSFGRDSFYPKHLSAWLVFMDYILYSISMGGVVMNTKIIENNNGIGGVVNPGMITQDIYVYFEETSVNETIYCDNESLGEDSDDYNPRCSLEDATESKYDDLFEEDEILSAADRFRCFLHAAYDIIIAPSYRIPKKVKKIRVYPDNCFFGVCPRCNKSIDREYQDFCNCCGQRLDWSVLDEAEEERISRNRK